MYDTTALVLYASYHWLKPVQSDPILGSEHSTSHHLNFALGRESGPLPQKFMQGELAALEACATLLFKRYSFLL